ncbi:hypothetical protein AU186_05105 [Mycobacterium sp. GA-1999]|nr:hypothetical protein AU185_18390 [Mycobacterium sp. GA-0227b]KUH88395.1 hypothetical protein AU187_03710 [Mycobacterium sp. IS-1556]KUH91867.1 hypothetical protein AU186_05105 [Mycobacterium sp. GA-1999]
MRIASVSRMPKPVIQCESAHVWLKGEKTYRSADYEIGLSAGGMLILREKPPVDWRELSPSFLEYVLVAPHGWNLVRTASLDKLTIDGSHWCSRMALWFPDDAPRVFAEDKCRLRVIDGGMLLFQAESGDRDFVIVHPHGWSAVKGMFDFTK